MTMVMDGAQLSLAVRIYRHSGVLEFAEYLRVCGCPSDTILFHATISIRGFIASRIYYNETKYV
jgi:hypothetical protein